MAHDLRIRNRKWRVRRERALRGELRSARPRGLAHQPAQRVRAGDQAANMPSPLAMRCRAQAVAQRIAIARTSAPAIAAAGLFGNKIVRRFFAIFGSPSPRPFPRRARKRRQDDG